MIKEIKEAMGMAGRCEDYLAAYHSLEEVERWLRYLLNEIERKDKALQDVKEAVWDEMVPSTLAARVHQIVEEGLK